MCTLVYLDIACLLLLEHKLLESRTSSVWFAADPQGLKKCLPQHRDIIKSFNESTELGL